MCGQVCLGLGLAELAVVCFSAAGIAAYTTVAVLGGLAAGQSGLEGICSGTGPCAYEFGIWLIADAAVGLSICWAGIGVCLSTRCTKKPQPLSSGCRARLAVFGATALVVELACTVVGAVLVWHPLRCFQRCSVFTKVRRPARPRADIGSSSGRGPLGQLAVAARPPPLGRFDRL